MNKNNFNTLAFKQAGIVGLVAGVVGAMYAYVISITSQSVGYSTAKIEDDIEKCDMDAIIQDLTRED